MNTLKHLTCNLYLEIRISIPIDLLQLVHNMIYHLKSIKKKRNNHLKVTIRPIVPNNVESWQVFESNQHIVNFLREQVEFSQPNQ